MPILSWQDSYSVGVKRIDDEHKTLIDMINEAYDAAKNESDDVVIKKLANGMRDYAVLHFSTEENLMNEYHYPDTDMHCGVHDAFMEKALVCKDCVNGLDTTNPIEVIRYLADWLNGHILGTDKELGAFLNSKGVK